MCFNATPSPHIVMVYLVQKNNIMDLYTTENGPFSVVNKSILLLLCLVVEGRLLGAYYKLKCNIILMCSAYFTLLLIQESPPPASPRSILKGGVQWGENKRQHVRPSPLYQEHEVSSCILVTYSATHTHLHKEV